MEHLKRFIICFLFSYWFCDLKVWEVKPNVLLISLIIFGVITHLKITERVDKRNVNTSNNNTDFKLSIFNH